MHRLQAAKSSIVQTKSSRLASSTHTITSGNHSSKDAMRITHCCSTCRRATSHHVYTRPRILSGDSWLDVWKWLIVGLRPLWTSVMSITLLNIVSNWSLGRFGAQLTPSRRRPSHLSNRLVRHTLRLLLLSHAASSIMVTIHHQHGLPW